MKQNLTRQEVIDSVADFAKDIPRPECLTCDCFQGFLTQLELDTEDYVSDVIEKWKIDRSEMHECLGCDPCPPGAAFAKYFKQAKDK